MYKYYYYVNYQDYEENLARVEIKYLFNEEIIKFELPYEHSLRTLYKVTKNKVTPLIYPRQYSQIKNR